MTDINRIIPQPAHEDLDIVLGKLKEAKTVIMDIAKEAGNIRFSGGGGLQGAYEFSNKTTQAQGKLSAAVVEYNRILAEKERVEARLAVVENNANIQLLESKQAYADKKKEVAALNDEYKKLTIETNKAVAAAKAAMAAEIAAGKATKDWSAETLKLVGNAQKLQTQLLAVDKTVGDSRRQVGNYNIISMEMGRVLQDTSSFAYGFGQGMMGIGNNIFVVMERMKMMRSEGMGWSMIVKEMGLSLVSPINLLTVGINVLTIWATRMKDSKDNTEDATKANKEYADSISNLINKQRQANTARGAFTDIGTKSAEKELELMKAQGASASAIAAQEQKVAGLKKRDLQNEIDAYDVLKGKIRSAYDYYANQGYKDEVIRERMAGDKDIIRSLKEVTGATTEEATKQAQAIADTYNTQDSFIKEFNNKQIELKNQQKEIDADVAINAAERHKDSLDKQSEEDKKYYQIRKELLAELAKANADVAKMYFEIEMRDQQSIISNEQSTNDEKIAAYTKYMDAKLGMLTIEKQESMGKAQAEYFAEVDKINALLVAEQRKNELRLLAEKKFQADLKAIQSNYEVKAYDAQMDASEGIAKNTKPIGPNKRAIAIAMQGIKDYQKYRQDWERKEKQEHDELIRRKIQNLQALREASATVMDAITQIMENSTKRDVARIENEIQQTDKQAEREKKAVEKSALSAEEKEQRMADIDARADQRKNLLQQREAQRQQRQADFEKGMAILKATIALYVGIAQEIEKGGVIGIATGAAVAAYMATVIATLSSTSVPQYAEGVDSHPGGLAIVGEGRAKGGWVPEWIKEPGKAGRWVTEPTLLNLSAGTSVTPLDKMSNALMMPKMAESSVSRNADMINLANAMTAGFDKLAGNQPVEVNFIMKNGELMKTVKRGNYTTTYYNAHNK